MCLVVYKIFNLIAEIFSKIEKWSRDNNKMEGEEEGYLSLCSRRQAFRNLLPLEKIDLIAGLTAPEVMVIMQERGYFYLTTKR